MSSVGVFIQNYNYGCFLEEAFNSVIMQSYKPDKFYIIDDCSTDNSLEIISKLKQKYNFELIKNEQNLGCVLTLNKIVTMIDTDYVCGLSADDLFGHSDYLQNMKNILDNDNKVGMVYNNICEFGTVNYLFNVEEYSYDLLMHHNYIHGSAMYRKECFNKVGGYRVIKTLEDWALWKDIVNSGYVAQKEHLTQLNVRRHNLGHRNQRTDNQRGVINNPGEYA